MSEQRRAEIEAKKARIEEFRRVRAEREAARAAERRPLREAGASPSRRAVEELVNSLLSESPRQGGKAEADTTASESIENAPSPSGPEAQSMSSNSTDDVTNIQLTPRSYTNLIDVEQELFELPQKERIVYSKEVQATVTQNGTYEGETEEQTPARRTTETEEKEPEDEGAKLGQEIQAEILEMTEEERVRILTAPELLEFIERTSKIVQRALNDNYDHLRDYTLDAESSSDATEGRIKRVCEFFDERLGKNRSVTDIDWSPKYPELSVASYNKNGSALNEPDGIVAVWNLHLLERPEFVFHSQSDVLAVTFSPFHPNLIFGGTYSGQILLWDTRSKHLPVLKTPLSATGHTHPVYALRVVGTQNAHTLVTCSSDGTVCTWLVNMLAQPQETLELLQPGHSKTNEVAITTLDFPANETSTFWVGTEEGSIYQAHRYDRAGVKAGLSQQEVYKGHHGPVLGLNFHPSNGPVDFSDLFLSSSGDWTVKLWRARLAGKPRSPKTTNHLSPLHSFDQADDYVYDAKWHPTHPALFGTVDGSGRFDIWNLNIDIEAPVASATVGSGRGLNKIEWDRKEGRRAALGGSDGRLYIYDVGDMAAPRETEWVDMQKVIAGMLEGQMNGITDSRL
ncbi:dynein intermediate chain [Coprinopsis cinerea AmutBmut pab1-1]|nr:dynein intermediate chain [Coprinopsis cinerea AmutBmut pab1-1]